MALVFRRDSNVKFLHLSKNTNLELEPKKTRNLKCRDYGFDCDFKAEGETIHIITEFNEHCKNIHGIEYGAATAYFIRRKYSKLNF